MRSYSPSANGAQAAHALRVQRSAAGGWACAANAANTLGHGFVEKVHENALAFELRRAKIVFVQRQSIEVLYEGEKVGHYKADLIVEGTFATDRAVLYLLQKHR
jgi:GxxExxY protein